MARGMRNRVYPQKTPIAAGILLVMGIVAGWFVLRPDLAGADYTPPPNTPGYTTVGSGGALVQNQSTNLDHYDAVGVWNYWTAKSKLAVGSSGCGVSTSCIIYANENATLSWTYCDLENLPDPGDWAKTYQITSSRSNIGDADCDLLAPTYPIFVVGYNASLGLGSTQRLHVQRHELAHAIGLGDASTVTCWQEYGYWLPLMRNGGGSSCLVFPQNYTASFNEAVAAVIRSGW